MSLLDEAEKSFSPREGQPCANELLEGFIVTDSDVKDIQGQRYLFDDFIIDGHIIALIAEPNAGKTAIAMFLAQQFVETGKHCLYFNLDASAQEIQRHQKIARDHGYLVVCPDMKVGRSIDEAMQALEQLADARDVGNIVVILDTLKKCADVMSKGGSKSFYKMLRRLTTRGATVILLGHANKYRDQEGDLIYEGTGDLRSDVDDLIYLEYSKTATVQVISAYPDKSRGVIRKHSFELDLQTRQVEHLEHFEDVKRGSIAEEQQRKFDPDGTIKAAILGAIDQGITVQKDIVAFVNQDGIGQKSAVRSLKEGSDPKNAIQWLTVRTDRENGNAKVYSRFTGTAKVIPLGGENE